MQYNIYIRRDNWEKFKDEKLKAELINGLLQSHYKGTPAQTKPKKAVEELKKLPQIKTADEIAIDAFAGKQLTCPEGHPSRDGRHCNNLKCAYGG